jgi:hypothetical protein
VEGWERKTLHEVATINYGSSPANVLAEDGLYPVVGIGDGSHVEGRKEILLPKGETRNEKKGP